MATSSTLIVHRVSRRFGALRALAEVSFTAARQQIVGLIGPNGAGKTTLLECLSGLLSADGGNVLWEDQELAPQQRRAIMFYLPEVSAPFPQHTVRQVLRFFGDVYGIDRRSVAALIGTLGLSTQLERPLERLSKGWRRRVLLGIGLLTPHPLLLIDEPFDGLDLRQTQEMMNVLRGAVAQGRTLVLSIHQLHEAQRICDRFVLLSEGRVAGEGTLPELRTRAKMEQAQLEDVFLALS